MDYNKPTLPKESKSKRKKMLLYAAAGGAAVAIAMIVLFVIPANTPQYSLSVEPRNEMVMGAGLMSRVYLTNTGSEQLTNIKLNWGSTSDNLPILNPGVRVMFSPPSSATMVTVTAEHGISIMKSLTNPMS